MDRVQEKDKMIDDMAENNRKTLKKFCKQKGETESWAKAIENGVWEI